MNEIYDEMIFKLRKRYSNYNNLDTGNDKLHTRIIVNAIEGYNLLVDSIHLDNDELPILECKLENDNYFLMTTKRMISIYMGIKYELYYSDYWWYDDKIFKENMPFFEGKTKTFKYYSLNKNEFWYEIDSKAPADAAHNYILYKLRNPNPPPLNELPNFR